FLLTGQPRRAERALVAYHVPSGRSALRPSGRSDEPRHAHHDDPRRSARRAHAHVVSIRRVCVGTVEVPQRQVLQHVLHPTARVTSRAKGGRYSTPVPKRPAPAGTRLSNVQPVRVAAGNSPWGRTRTSGGPNA